MSAPGSEEFSEAAHAAAERRREAEQFAEATRTSTQRTFGGEDRAAISVPVVRAFARHLQDLVNAYDAEKARADKAEARADKAEALKQEQFDGLVGWWKRRAENLETQIATLENANAALLAMSKGYGDAGAVASLRDANERAEKAEAKLAQIVASSPCMVLIYPSNSRPRACGILPGWHKDQIEGHPYQMPHWIKAVVGE